MMLARVKLTRAGTLPALFENQIRNGVTSMDVLVVDDVVGRTLVFGPFKTMEAMDDFIASHSGHWEDWTVVAVLEPTKEAVPTY
jgi:hypothetical protein